MDRNPVGSGCLRSLVMVALRKESVDRNQVAVHFVGLSAVALRKESVDRNMCLVTFGAFMRLSLSARRAWIEIFTRRTFAYVS